jgi:Fe2+ transport system protein B
MNLKPVVVIENHKQGSNFYKENLHAQNILLKALSDGITDINELKKLAGFKVAADVYRTLDKMAIRKEYHAALERGGMSLDYLVSNLKGIIDNTEKDDNKIKAIQLLMKSIGLDKYEKQEEMGKGWEEVLLQTVDKKSGQGVIETADYKVIAPVKSEARQKQKEEEEEIGEQLYGN